MKKIKILLVDDHKLVRNGIRYSLESSSVSYLIGQIDEASEGNEAISLNKAHNYDIIFMDINMPGISGIETTREIKRNDKYTKIIALSMYDEDYEIRSMIKAGAVGYLLKDTGTEILEDAVKTILRGGNYYSNEVAIKLMAPYNEDALNIEKISKGTPRFKDDVLTDRELEVLTLIASEETNDEIANRLKVSRRTIDSHRQNIIRKLQVKNTAGLIKYAFKIGLI
ncbi:MAG: response regulator transcription factor [Crocinitomicaceae bacterium]